jgi:hypothetical protein
MSHFETIKKLIQDSSLEAVDKQELVDTFAEISDESLEDIAKLLEKDPSWVIKFSDNRKKKKEAFATGSQDLWDQILEEEKKYIQEMTYGLD